MRVETKRVGELILRHCSGEQGTLLTPQRHGPLVLRGPPREPAAAGDCHLPDGVRVLRQLSGGFRQPAGAARLRRREQRSARQRGTGPSPSIPVPPGLPSRERGDVGGGCSAAPHSPLWGRGRSAGPPPPARLPTASRRAQGCGPRAGPSGQHRAGPRAGRRRGASGPAGAAPPRAGGGRRPPSSAGPRPLAWRCRPRARRLL